MTRCKGSIPAITASALMVAIPLTAADKSAADKGNSMAPAAKHTMRKAETLTGKIIEVDAAKKLVVVETTGAVAFDMVVTAKTRIRSGERSLALKDLGRDVNKTVSITFTPEHRGDVAKSIQVTG